MMIDPNDAAMDTDEIMQDANDMHDRSDRSLDIPIIDELMHGIQRLVDTAEAYVSERTCGFGGTPPSRSRSSSPAAAAALQTTNVNVQPQKTGTSVAASSQTTNVGKVPSTETLKKLEKSMMSGGILQLSFADITKNELKWILLQLNEKQSAARRLPITADSTSVFKINLAGNRNLGDAVAEYLHLIPDTVCDLDLSYCGLSSTGIRHICQFLETNHTITRLVLWGNVISVAGAMYIRDMFKKNTTLEELCCYTSGAPMPTKAKLLIADGLEQNSTLKRLLLDDCKGTPAESEVYIAFHSCLERAGNKSALQTLEIGPIDHDPNIKQWANTVRRCENLVNLGANSDRLKHNPEYMFWLNLNLSNARKIAREGKVDKFQALLAKTAKEGKDDMTYYLIRNNVDYIPG